jgi:hypothetical protein
MMRFRRTFKAMAVAAQLAAATQFASGCAVYMAATGDQQPNLSNVHRGASRGEVEMALGQPKTLTTTDDGGTAATYEYVRGNEPSAGRAIGHGVLDILTVGIWEAVGTPIEATNQGDKVTVDVHYDADGNATSVASNTR